MIKIYLDNCCFNRPFDDQRHIKIRLETEAKLYVQEKIIEGQIELVWSYILDFENECNPYEERRNAIKDWKQKASFDLEENKDILKMARMLEKNGMKSKDALHVACAIAAGCDYFVTSDDQIINKLKNFKKIIVLNPVDFVSIIGD